MHYRGEVALVIYTDDGIFIGPDQDKIQECHDLLTKKHKDPTTGVEHRAFKMTDEGSLSDYLGVKIKPMPNGTIKLYQPHVISGILRDLGFNEKNTKSKRTPALASRKLNRDITGEDINEDWNY